ncbi:MAG: ORF6N domain-containing protein [Treponema sp.]|nr:ORF6N domain-containing protein [Treponema sp.]
MEENKETPIQNLIYEIRGHKVMLDHDLAQLYGVLTQRLNEAVKRNKKRFPEDFMFQLTDNEWKSLISQFAISKKSRGGRRFAPFAFTEHGISMLSTVLNSDRAIEINISIMRAFVKLRHFVHSEIGTNEQITELRRLLMLHIDNNDYKFSEYDKAIKQILFALNNLIEKPKESKRIGF